ncbi:lipoprotein [Borreliella chilensis]|uniref:Lipoprotein n=1 Tax=Borreliella chilensis TaxID=1245910 RepID=A0A0A7UV89_9SPIR|nr:lipoprotein [Borreliella chilensis]
MIFSTYKYLKLAIMLMLILGCAFFKKPQSVQQDSNIGKPISDEKLHLISGKILNKKLPIISGNHDVTWIKTKAMTILDEHGKAIPEFKNKFGYSYILSPIKMDDNHSNFTSLLILFETTKDGDKEYEIEDIKLITAGSNLELKNPLLVVENSQEEGYVTAYPFGMLMSDELKNAFKLTYQNGHWNYMIADLTVKNKTTQKTQTYKISLNSKLIIDFLKDVLKENSILKDIAGDLFEDI